MIQKWTIDLKKNSKVKRLPALYARKDYSILEFPKTDCCRGRSFNIIVVSSLWQCSAGEFILRRFEECKSLIKVRYRIRYGQDQITNLVPLLPRLKRSRVIVVEIKHLLFIADLGVIRREQKRLTTRTEKRRGKTGLNLFFGVPWLHPPPTPPPPPHTHTPKLVNTGKRGPPIVPLLFILTFSQHLSYVLYTFGKRGPFSNRGDPIVPFVIGPRFERLKKLTHTHTRLLLNGRDLTPPTRGRRGFSLLFCSSRSTWRFGSQTSQLSQE